MQKAIISLCISLLLTLGSITCYALSYKITRLTDNNYLDYPCSACDGTVAWGANLPSSPNQIQYWDGNTITQITNSSRSNGYPSLWNGTIAWQRDLLTYGPQVYYWYGSTITQVTNNNLIDYGPSVYNGTIVWAGGDPNDQSTWEIYYWDGSSIAQVTNNNFKDEFPKIHNRIIAWNAKIDDSNYEIYVAEPILSPPVTDPSVGATVVPVNANITATFFDQIDPRTVDTNSFFISGVTGSVSYDAGAKTATFTPAADLEYSTTYSATITTDVEDLDGHVLATDYTWSFTTGTVPVFIPTLLLLE